MSKILGYFRSVLINFITNCQDFSLSPISLKYYNLDLKKNISKSKNFRVLISKPSFFENHLLRTEA